MSSHDLTVAGYAVVVLTGVAMQLLSRRPGSRIPSLPDLLSWAMRTRSGRVGVLAGWAWIGVHFFAR